MKPTLGTTAAGPLVIDAKRLLESFRAGSIRQLERECKRSARILATEKPRRPAAQRGTR